MGRIEYRFRTYLDGEQLNIALANFLKKKSTDFTEKDRVFSALSAYWLPIALKDEGTLSDQQLKQYARNAIYKLKLHISYLVETFGLEDIELPMSATKKVQLQQPATISLEPDESSFEEQDLSVSDSKDLIYHDDDSTFQQMFG